MTVWVDRCRQCDQNVTEISGDPPNEHVEPCGHDRGWYAKLEAPPDPEYVEPSEAS